MHWMENNPDRRTDPRLVLEEARSVIVVARNYAPGDLLRSRTQRNPGNQGKSHDTLGAMTTMKY